MNSTARRLLLVLGALVAVCCVGAILVRGPLWTMIQDRLYDNVPSGVACEDLPTRAQVQQAVEEHADLVRRIEQVGGQPNIVLVLVDDTRCGGSDRAEIVIFYPGHGERVRIEEILKGESFGVPVALRNV